MPEVRSVLKGGAAAGLTSEGLKDLSVLTC
jgi:hypothetical protein